LIRVLKEHKIKIIRRKAKSETRPGL